MHSVNFKNIGAIGLISFSNPPDGYMTDSFVNDIWKAFRRADNNPDTRVVILTGEQEGIFIQHYDLNELKNISIKLNAREKRYTENDHVRERDMDLLLRAIDCSNKPVIAAINGNAMGFGCELSLACDFRYMADGNYFIGQPEIKAGLIPGAGGTQRLTRIVGQAVAMDMVLFGKRLNPSKALNIGLVHELASDISVLDLALQRASQLTELSVVSLSHAKKLIRTALEFEIYEGLDRERSLFVDTLATPFAKDSLEKTISENKDFRTV